MDTLYSALAIWIGAVAAPVIASWGDWPAMVGGCALIVIAGVGLWRAAAGETADSSDPPPGSGGRLFVLFLGLTAVNPATLVYFTAIAVGLSQLLQTPPAAALFVVGVGVASISWQLLVITAGAVLGLRAPRTKRGTALMGNLIVAGLGVAMIVSAVL